MQGGERHENFSYPDEQWIYFFMADRFGWTPEQVDNLPAATADWLVSISQIYDEVKAERAGNGG